MAFTETGNFVARGAEHVDPMLVAILQAAAERTGMNVQAYSGYRPGDPRFHGKGIATDVRIIGPDGKEIPNYQDAAGFSQYEKLAQEARKVQMEQYPQLGDKFRWGGYFSGGKGKYGAMDTMHFDLGGSPALGMAGGSWEGGLTPAQAALFPGVQSHGMGAPAVMPDGPKGREMSPPPLTAGKPVNDYPVGQPPAAMPSIDVAGQGEPAPESGLSRIFAALAPMAGSMGGGGMPQGGPAQSFGSGDPMGATFAAAQAADRANGLAAGLAPNIDLLMGLGKRPGAALQG